MIWVDDGFRAFAAVLEGRQEETGTARGRGKGKEVPRCSTGVEQLVDSWFCNMSNFESR